MMVNKTDNHCINFIKVIFDENIFHIKLEQKFLFLMQYKIIDNTDIFTVNIKYWQKKAILYENKICQKVLILK